MRAGLGAVVGTGRDGTTPSEAANLGVPAEEDPPAADYFDPVRQRWRGPGADSGHEMS